MSSKVNTVNSIQICKTPENSSLSVRKKTVNVKNELKQLPKQVQKPVEKAGKEIDSSLRKSRRERYQAEVDLIPILPLASTLPTLADQQVALNRLAQAKEHIQTAKNIRASLDNKILKGQYVPATLGKDVAAGSESLSKNKDGYFQGSVEDWQRYNNHLYQTHVQREGYTSAIKTEETRVNDHERSIKAGREQCRALDGINRSNQFLNSLPSSSENENNNNSSSPNAPSSESQKNEGVKERPFGFQF